MCSGAVAIGERLMRALGLLASLSGLPFVHGLRAEDIPLDNCKVLATIKATAERRPLTFLVDTGASSTMLNAKSFPQGNAAHILMYSWNGEFQADGREIWIDDLAIDGHHLNAMALLAVDLSDLVRGCGEQIDGIMGADLITKLGLEIDLKKRVARFAAGPEEQKKMFAGLREQLEVCRAAIDRSDVKGFGDCLDPDVVLVASGKDFRGRNAVLKYLDREYLVSGLPATMSIDRSTYHAVGEVVWLEYELRIRSHDRTVREGGTALFQESRGKWLVVNIPLG